MNQQSKSSNTNSAIRSTRIITPSGIIEGVILIENGKIKDILPYNASADNFDIEDVGNNVVMPGVIDPHVHINEPGRTDWEGFDTATKAAAAGGITTLIEMPLNASPVTTTSANFRVKLNAAKNKLHVNCGFWGGVVPDNLHQLEELLQSGVFGLKAFLTHSGIDDFPNTTAEHLRIALKYLKKYHLPLLVHCEIDEPHPGIDELKKNPSSYKAYLNSRPKSWENKAIQVMIDLCRETGAHVHIVHLSSAEAIPMIASARKEGLPLTVESAQHYLYFNAESINDGDTAYKCAPPIRESENNEQLWSALRSGIIDFIATDHSPAPPDLKEIQSGNFIKAWGGIAGIQFALPVAWTAAKSKNYSLQDICNWLCVNPSKLAGLENKKGKILKDYDADITVWNPEKEFIVEVKDIYHRHKITPYLHQKLSGVVEQTWLNGIKIFDQGNFLNLNTGKILLKSGIE